MRIIARSVWNMLVFLLNSLIFMLIGLQLSDIVARIERNSTTELVVAGVLVSAVAIAVRFVWIHPAAWLSRALAGRAEKKSSTLPEPELVIMSWCGMRGIVSLAAALALPVTLPGGAPFPYRDLIIFLTFVVIAATLVLQGLTLSPLIRWLKEHQVARTALGSAAAAAIDAEAQAVSASADVAARIRAEFADKIAHAAPDPDALAATTALEPGAALARQLRRAAIGAERAELLRIWRDNLISDEVLHHIEEELDYQESHL
jgi:CPA1 family monovalent cation:H+ antiporter